MKITLKNLRSADIGAKRDRFTHAFYKEMAIIYDDRQTPCRFRFYGNNSRIHCIAWISGNEVYGSGYGYADGYGYCKESAAMEAAIKSAGIDMGEHWGGVGETKMREAALSIAQKVTGKRSFILHTAHG